MAKKHLSNPDSAEREYTRLLLAFSRQLASDVNAVLLPELGAIKSQFDGESRADAWTDYLGLLMADIAAKAYRAIEILTPKLPNQFEVVSKHNDRQFKMVVKANTGLELPLVAQGAPRSLLGVSPFRTEPYLAPLAEGWVSENTSLIKSLPTKMHPEIEGIIRRGVMNGESVKTLKDKIKDRYHVTDYRAKLIAQDQTLKLNADLTRCRLQSVGVKEYIWRTVNDSRVRPDHIEREGKTYSWDKPPSGGEHPGHEVRCRCRAEAIWDDEQEELASEAPVAPTGRPGGVAGADEPKPVSATSAKVAERVNNSVLYHGTGKQFDKFSLSKLHTGADEGADSWYGHGIYLSGEKWKASSYAYAAGASGRIVSAKAVIRNPFVVSDTSASALTDALKALGIDPSTPPSALTKKLKERGYDSVVVLSERKGTINEVVLFNDKSVQIVGSEGL